jgi:hypothetical protein
MPQLAAGIRDDHIRPRLDRDLVLADDDVVD